MATALLPIILQLLDDNGNPDAGKVRVYDAGTTNVHDIFTEPTYTTTHAQPVVADSVGRFVDEIFVDPSDGDYKIQILSSADVVLIELDNISPAVSGTVAVTQGGTGSTTASAARTALSVPSQAQHDALDTRVTTAESTISNNIDTSTEALTWAATTNINHASQSQFNVTLAGATAFTVSNLRDGGTLRLLITQDGTGGRAVTFPSEFVFEVEPPIIDQTAGGTTIVEGVVVSGVIYAEVIGKRSLWDYVAYNQQAQNTAGGAATTGSWQDMPLNTANRDIYGLGNPASGVISVPAGIWEAEWFAPFFACGVVQTQLYDNTGAAEIEPGTVTEANVAVGSESDSTGYAYFTLSSTSNISLRYQCGLTKATDGLGQQGNFGSERYAWLRLRKVASL